MRQLNIKDYQEGAVDFLVENETPFLIAKPGSGKTICVLSALTRLFADKKINGVLIVAPLRVATITWPQEIESWDEFKHLSYAVLHGRRKEARYFEKKKIYLINFEGLPFLYELIRQTKTLLFSAIVIDESTKIKAFSLTNRNKMLRSLGKHVKRRMCLTGTPMPGSHLDLYSQVRFLDNGERFGTSMSKFRMDHFREIPYKKYQWEMIPGHGKIIEDQMSDIVYTIDDEATRDLPGITETDIDLTLPAEAKSQYKAMEKEFFVNLKAGIITAANAAVMSSKLRQITSGCVYDSEGVAQRIHNGKMEALTKYLEARKEKSILIFYNFRFEKEDIKNIYPSVRFFGGDSKKNDKQTLTDWSGGKIKVMAASPVSAGHGLNLQFGGSTILWYSPNYSQELWEQGNCRLYRSGQKEHVEVSRFVTKNTIEEVVASVSDRRGDNQVKLIEALKLYRGRK